MKKPIRPKLGFGLPWSAERKRAGAAVKGERYLGQEMSGLNGQIDNYETVKVWFNGLRQQSGVDPASDPSRLKLLEEFCRFTDLNPDEVLKACLLEKQGRDTKISIKGRRLMAEKIADFQAAPDGLSSRERAHRGNTIRSFLIHNGILLQAGVQV